MSNYEQIRKFFKTGDIVLFSGNGLISNAIKLVSGSEWSHVGMVINSVEIGSALLWESTMLVNKKQNLFRDIKNGVQISLLSERITGYKGNVSIRYLKNSLNECGPWIEKDKLQKLLDFRSEVKGRPYEKNKIELFRSAYDGRYGENVEDLSSLFCSELIAEAYQRMGLISEHKPSNEYTPKDFSCDGKIDFKNGVYLGSEIAIE